MWLESVVKFRWLKFLVKTSADPQDLKPQPKDIKEDEERDDEEKGV